MNQNGGEDEEKWLTAGVTGLQQNAFYMHRALVTANFTNLSMLLERSPEIDNPSRFDMFPEIGVCLSKKVDYDAETLILVAVLTGFE